MTTTMLEYSDIARIQIETAMELYNSGKFICAITLAGAGEEILGSLLSTPADTVVKKLSKELVFYLPNLSEKEVRDNHLNLIRNGFKHLKEEICEQDIPIRLHAFILIARACINYTKLTNKMTQEMVSFSEAHPPSSFDEVVA